MFSSKRILYHFDSCQCLYISLSSWSAKELMFEYTQHGCYKENMTANRLATDLD